MFFKNAIVYECSNTEVLNNINNELLQEITFKPCGSIDTVKGGFVSPVDNPDELMLNVQGQILLRYKTEQKILPSSVIKQAHIEKINKQEELLNRKLSKCEKATLKDEVLIDLIPRAFSKYNYYWLWIDIQNKRVIVDCSSFKISEDILALLRKELGALALTPLPIDKPLEQIMTTWVKEKLNFPPFILGDEAELKDPLEGNGIINCKNQEITSAEMVNHLESGKWITKLKICDERGVSYVLDENLTFKQIRFDPTVLDENEDIPVEDKAARIEADFFLMSKTLSNSINDIKQVFEKII